MRKRHVAGRLEQHAAGEALTAAHLGVRHRAKRGSSYDLALDELAECVGGGDVEDEYGARELAEAIDRFLDTLSYEDRFLFVRRYWFADTLPKIAEMAGMRYGTASVRLHRIREKLRTQLIKEGLMA